MKILLLGGTGTLSTDVLRLAILLTKDMMSLF